MYLIHCTRVVSELAPILYGQIMSKSLFVGFEPKMKLVQRDVFGMKTFWIDMNHFLENVVTP